ncbi:hypothetical protein B0I35DRAFT_421123 [Stachybotrys elegans]|uniref:Uncharacterized protein n=1 Tax=Stachybotrys elegans TaxID=80388 RepID=A0A8K0WUK6_9HYPO|nr:hypothetical protein B0I35DRAFT_421123 [Stachybotrys elegans]
MTGRCHEPLRDTMRYAVGLFRSVRPSLMRGCPAISPSQPQYGTLITTTYISKSSIHASYSPASTLMHSSFHHLYNPPSSPPSLSSVSSPQSFSQHISKTKIYKQYANASRPQDINTMSDQKTTTIEPVVLRKPQPAPFAPKADEAQHEDQPQEATEAKDELKDEPAGDKTSKDTKLPTVEDVIDEEDHAKKNDK